MDKTKAGVWYNIPGAWKYHVVRDGHIACDSKHAIEADTELVDAAEIPHAQRCQRSGCRQRWPVTNIG